MINKPDEAQKTLAEESSGANGLEELKIHSKNIMIPMKGLKQQKSGATTNTSSEGFFSKLCCFKSNSGGADKQILERNLRRVAP